MFLLFFFIWIIFNGRITGEIIAFGLVIAAAVFAFICKFMDYSLEKEKVFCRKSLWFVGYLILLIEEIVKANVTVMRMVVSGNQDLQPVIVTFHTSLKTEVARVILANSITLTPGTITVSLEGDELTVHCLDESLAVGMEDSVFVKRLEVLEGKVR